MTAETALTIRGGTALVGPELEVFPAGEILIRGGAIESVGERGAGSDGAVIDAEGCFVVPGLTDAHVHMDLEAGADVVAGWHADSRRARTSDLPQRATRPRERDHIGARPRLFRPLDAPLLRARGRRTRSQAREWPPAGG